MFDEFFIKIVEAGLAAGYDIYTIGSRASEWYSRGQLTLNGFRAIQDILVPTAEGDGGEQD